MQWYRGLLIPKPEEIFWSVSEKTDLCIITNCVGVENSTVEKMRNRKSLTYTHFCTTGYGRRSLLRMEIPRHEGGQTKGECEEIHGALLRVVVAKLNPASSIENRAVKATLASTQ